MDGQAVVKRPGSASQLIDRGQTVRSDSLSLPVCCLLSLSSILSVLFCVEVERKCRQNCKPESSGSRFIQKVWQPIKNADKGH